MNKNPDQHKIYINMANWIGETDNSCLGTLNNKKKMNNIRTKGDT